MKYKYLVPFFFLFTTTTMSYADEYGEATCTMGGETFELTLESKNPNGPDYVKTASLKNSVKAEQRLDYIYFGHYTYRMKIFSDTTVYASIEKTYPPRLDHSNYRTDPFLTLTTTVLSENVSCQLVFDSEQF